MNLDGDYFPVVGFSISAKNSCQVAKGVKQDLKKIGRKPLLKEIRALCVKANNEMRACKSARGVGCVLKQERASAKSECDTITAPSEMNLDWGSRQICSWT